MDTKINSQRKLTIILDRSSSAKDTQSKNSIDKKITKIDLLKRQIKDLLKQIEIVKNICKEELIVEQEKAYFLNKEKLLFKLFNRYQQSSFSLWQKEILERRILDEIDILVNNGHESQRVSEIHEEITKIVNENISDFEKEIFNDMAKEMFNNMGVDVDEENFDFTDFADPEFREQFQKKYSEKYSEDQKQEKYENQEEKAKNTNQYFQKLYRKLVKKTHPDLVVESEEKERREILMKKLSQAWSDRKYYQLLLLQKEIDSDSTMEVLLDKKQLKPLINQLNEEIRGLEMDKYILKKEDPDTSYYYTNFYAKSKKGILKKTDDFKAKLLYFKEEDDDAFDMLKTQKSTKIMLAEIRQQNNNSSFDFW